MNPNAKEDEVVLLDPITPPRTLFGGMREWAEIVTAVVAYLRYKEGSTPIHIRSMLWRLQGELAKVTGLFAVRWESVMEGVQQGVSLQYLCPTSSPPLLPTSHLFVTPQAVEQLLGGYALQQSIQNVDLHAQQGQWGALLMLGHAIEQRVRRANVAHWTNALDRVWSAQQNKANHPFLPSNIRWALRASSTSPPDPNPPKKRILVKRRGGRMRLAAIVPQRKKRVAPLQTTTPKKKRIALGWKPEEANNGDFVGMFPFALELGTKTVPKAKRKRKSPSRKWLVEIQFVRGDKQLFPLLRQRP